jgi:hypothetical protein
MTNGSVTSNTCASACNGYYRKNIYKYEEFTKGGRAHELSLTTINYFQWKSSLWSSSVGSYKVIFLFLRESDLIPTSL